METNKLATKFEDYMETKWMEAAASLQKETTLAKQAEINAVVALNRYYRNIVQFWTMIRFMVWFAFIKLHLVKAPAFQSSKPVVVTAPNPEPQTKPILTAVPNTNLQD